MRSIVVAVIVAVMVLISCDRSSTEPSMKYEGAWMGTNSQGDTVGFRVQENEVVAITIAYQIEGSDGCSTAGAYGYPLDTPVEILNEKFSITDTLWSGGNDAEFYNFSGTFDSGSSAEGALSATWKSCGNVGLTWDAAKE